MDGTHAELIAVPRRTSIRSRTGSSFEEAAAFPLVFETAYRMLVTRAGPARGRVGAGLGHRERDRQARRIAIAKALGARAIVTSSSDEKLGGARSSEPTRSSTTARGRRRGGQGGDGRAGADVVVEHVGEATWQRTLQAAAPGRPHRRLRRDDRPEPAGGAPPDLVEAALDLRLDDGHEGRTSRASTSSSRAAGHGRSSTTVFPLSRGPRRPRAHGSRRAARQDRAHDPRVAERYSAACSTSAAKRA